MTGAERFRNWIDEVASGWADRLRGWMAAWLSWGIEVLMDTIAKRASPMLKPTIERIERETEIPPELKPIFNELKEPTAEFGALLANSAGGALVGGAIGKILDFLLRPITLGFSYVPGFVQLDPPQLLALWRRGEITEDDLSARLHELGFHSTLIEQLKSLIDIRLDPSAWITAFRREYEDFSQIEADLKDQGWSKERIEALKFVTQYYPAPADLIRWQAREVFEPEMIARYGLDSEFEAIEKEPFYKAGMTDEQILNYWRAHWEHASWMQVVEMLHRGLMTEEQVYDWFRVVEIPPFWRDLLIQSAYTWPTRVDVRRWWDMRTIDETELRRLYSGMGYRGVNLDNYVLWTKVYVAFPDLIARWRNGWITLEEVKSTLTGLGMPAARVEEFIETKVKATEPERTAKERDITKTDIIKGVKTAVISRGQGVELLLDMGYDEDEAVYILEINIPPDEEDVVFRQRELTKADILKGLKAAVITRAQARDRLLDLRYSAPDAEFLLKIYDAQVKPPTEPREREASKADIILAVKKDLITPEDAYLMLQDIDFTPEAAMFILEVKAEVSAFSPINFAEFKDRAQKYRRAAGMEIVEMPEEVKTAADEVVRLTAEVEALTQSIEEEQRGLIDQEIIPEETTKRLKSLQVKRNRAESKLSAAKSEYDRLVAEWKHGLP